MAYFLFIPFILVVFLAVAPLYFSLDGYFDLNRKMSALEIKLYGVTVIKLLIREADGEIVYSLNNNTAQKLQKNKRKKADYKKILPFFRSLKIKNVNYVVRIGAADAASSAILTALVDRLFSVFGANGKTYVDYNENTSLQAEIKGFTTPASSAVKILRENINERRRIKNSV